MSAVPDLPTLSRALQLWNRGDTDDALALVRDRFGRPGASLEALLDDPSHRLAVYGSLAPGECNEHILAPLAGSWLPGSVHGRFSDAGWGTALGYRSLVWDPSGPEVRVQVFESAELFQHWPRIDEFEGSGYRRIWVPVLTARGILVANLYAANL